MRLTPDELTGIIEAMDLFVEKNNALLYLCGSRTNDELKGGDIDLFLLVNNEQYNKLSSIKYKILSQIKKNIGDQKIDLFITTKEAISADPLLKPIIGAMLVLKEWKKD